MTNQRKAYGGRVWHSLRAVPPPGISEDASPLREHYSLDRYAICTPYLSTTDRAHMRCMDELRTRYDRLIVEGCPYIDMARAALAKTGEHHAGIVFIDHDITFEVNDVARLIAAAEDMKTLVSGIYCERNAGEGILVGQFEAKHATVGCFEAGGLYEGIHGGLGFCAIPRAVLEAVGAPLPSVDLRFIAQVKPMFAHDYSTGYYCGEDVSFFRRARAAGFPLWIDTRPRLGHVGRYEYHLEDATNVTPHFDRLTLNYEHTRPIEPPSETAAA